MTGSPDRPFNGHTKVLLMAAMVLVPLSLLLSTVAAVGGYFTSRDVAEQNDRLEQVVADLEAEIAARRAANCENTLEARSQESEMWEAIISGLGGSQRTVDAVRDGYESLPTPSLCE